MGQRQRCRRNRGRAAQPHVAAYQGWDPFLDQAGERADGQVDQTFLITGPIDQRKPAVDEFTWRLGRRLFPRKFDQGLDALVQSGTKVPQIAGVAEPKRVWLYLVHDYP